MTLLTLEKRGHVAILTLNRPESLNALGAPGDGDAPKDEQHGARCVERGVRQSENVAEFRPRHARSFSRRRTSSKSAANSASVPVG